MNVGTLVKRASAVFDTVWSPPLGVTILIYHRVGGGSGGAVDLDPAVFDDHLARLVDCHRVVTLDDALVELGLAPEHAGWHTVAAPRAGAASAPTADDRRAVVITFDDGTSDFLDHAVPALVRHGVPATLYAATHFIDTGEPFPWDAPPITWSALAEAASTGLVTVGSHTHSHWLLDRLDADEIGHDLDRSIELIGEHLGAAPEHFAYPKALPGSAVAEIAVRRRFRSAALAANRVNRPGRTDAHRLWRTPVQRTDRPLDFARKADGGLRLEGELRSAAARVRYRGDDR